MTYTIRHEFPETGEWGEWTVETHAEADRWFQTRTIGACHLTRVVSITDPAGTVTRHLVINNYPYSI